MAVPKAAEMCASHNVLEVVTCKKERWVSPTTKSHLLLGYSSLPLSLQLVGETEAWICSVLHKEMLGFACSPLLQSILQPPLSGSETCHQVEPDEF